MGAWGHLPDVLNSGLLTRLTLPTGAGAFELLSVWNEPLPLKLAGATVH